MTESANNSDLQVGEGEPQVNLPVSGGMSPTELPAFATQRSMPADDFRGAFTGVLSGFAGGMTGLPGQNQVTDVADLASNGGFAQTPQILPAPARADVEPFAGALGDLPTGDLPTGGLLTGDLPTGDLPTGDLLTGGLPTGGLPMGDLLTGGLPMGGLPMGGLPMGDLPMGDLTGNLPVAVPAALPVQRDLPTAPELPLTGDMLSPLSAISLDSFGGFGGFGGRSDVPADLTEATTIIPAIPATDDLTDVTTVMPVIPAAPGLDGIAGASLVQAPHVGTLPIPAVSEVAAPELGGSSLDSTRAALANLFTTHPIA
jgi:hypothetical protein